MLNANSESNFWRKTAMVCSEIMLIDAKQVGKEEKREKTP